MEVIRGGDVWRERDPRQSYSKPEESDRSQSRLRHFIYRLDTPPGHLICAGKAELTMKNRLIRKPEAANSRPRQKSVRGLVIVGVGCGTCGGGSCSCIRGGDMWGDA